MRPRHGCLAIADLQPRTGTEAGKVRPVLVIQSDLLNEAGHLSTWILPCTTRLTGDSLLRVPLAQGAAGNDEAFEILVDQPRAIDNRRFKRDLGPVPDAVLQAVKHRLRLLGELG